MTNGESGTPLWEVTGQQETVDLSDSGAYVNGVRISFRTRSGGLGSVFVPTAQYSPERVRALLEVRAADYEAVHRMTGEG